MGLGISQLGRESWQIFKIIVEQIKCILLHTQSVEVPEARQGLVY